MPSGSRRVDARVTLQTHDGAIVYVTYGGVLVITDAHFARMAKGECLTADDIYFIITPVFETSHERYAWLNGVQAIGKLVELRVGEGGYVKYDFFVVR